MGGPLYNSIADLKKDELYKGLSQPQKSKILRDSNKDKTSGFIFVKNSYNLNAEFMQHLILGTFKKGDARGVHHVFQILRGDAKIIKITRKPNKQGIWEAKIEILDRRTDVHRWKEKNEVSTFFPDKWDTDTLLAECNYAFENKMNPIENHDGKKWESNTTEGIPVEIYTDKKGDIITMYPIWIPDK